VVVLIDNGKWLLFHNVLQFTDFFMEIELMIPKYI
jgi:hypothetical protein